MLGIEYLCALPAHLVTEIGTQTHGVFMSNLTPTQEFGELYSMPASRIRPGAWLAPKLHQDINIAIRSKVVAHY